MSVFPFRFTIKLVLTEELVDIAARQQVYHLYFGDGQGLTGRVFASRWVCFVYEPHLLNE